MLKFVNMEEICSFFVSFYNFKRTFFMSKTKAVPTPEAIAQSKHLEELQKTIFSINDDNLNAVSTMILGSDESKSESGIRIITSMILTVNRTQIKKSLVLINFVKALISAEPKYKEAILEESMCYDAVFVTFANHRGNLLFIAKCIEYGVLSVQDVSPYIERYANFPEEYYSHAALIYYIFAPEIHTMPHLKEYFIKVIDFVNKTDQYPFYFQKLHESLMLLKGCDFRLIREYRKQGFMNNSIESIIILDSVDALKSYVDGIENDGIECSIYQSSSFLDSNPTPLMLAALHGSKKCFDYLLTKCDINATNIDNYTAAQFAAAGGNLEILKFIESKGGKLDGCLQIAIQYHNNEIVDYLVNEKKVSLTTAHRRFGLPLICALQADNLYVFNKFIEKDFDAHSKDKTMQPIIFQVAGHGSIAILSVLLMFKGINFNIKDKDQATLFFFAVVRSQLESVKMLLTVSNIDIDAKDKRSQCAVHVAAVNGEVEILKVLLNDERGNPNIGNRLGNTPLILALENKQLPAVDVLMGNSRVKITAMNTLGIKPIHLAAERNYLDILKRLIARKVDINTKTKKEGKAAIHYACELGHVDILKALLECEKIDINIQTLKGVAPIHYAIEGNHKEEFQLLLEKGADYNIKNITNETPLHFALQCKNDEYAQVLINLKDIDIKTSTSEGWTALHFAANNGFFDMCVKLISMGCDVNAKTKQEKTPLHYAAQTGRVVIMSILVENGADPSALDMEERTPLHYAAENGHVEACEFLLKQKNVDVNAKTFHLFTPLIFAAKYNHLSTVQLLLNQKGIDVNCETDDGLTAMKCAEIARAEDVIPVLKLY